MILSLSNGLTTVREAAPATPPAMKYDESCGLSHVTTGFFSSFFCSVILTGCAEDSNCCWGWIAGAVCCGDVMT